MKTKFKLPFSPKHLILPGIILFTLGLGYWFIMDNRAQHVAAPFEQALIRSGAVKLNACTGGDAGRGPDNSKPGYNPAFTINADRQKATELIRQAARDSGFELIDGTPPANPLDNKFYEDLTKPSLSSDLEDGKIQLLVTVFGSSRYDTSGGKCVFVQTGNADPNQTTFEFSVGLPRFKRF